VFVLLKFVYVIYKLTLLTEADYKANVFNYFILPGNLSTFLHRPWTIFTYMFVHSGVMRVLGNLLWLWAFGFIIQDLMGNRKIIPLFIYGGLLGGIFFILTYTLFFNGQAQSPTLEGASAGFWPSPLPLPCFLPLPNIPHAEWRHSSVGAHPRICDH
jgi:membrane associated rhomboid family serine protease